ncbi:MAG: hypothetical protein IJM81_01905 [Prevotella sp.]|nr:hypothetical protein [Prevotella sp.]
MFSILITIFLSVPANAQRKELAQARQLIKAKNNLAQAEQSMRNLLADSANRKNTKIWLTLFEAIKKQYEIGNEKLYLKQPYDTAQLFLATKKMFDVLESFDSIDAHPDKYGKIKWKYRRKHSEYIKSHRPNLYNGGSWFIKKQDFAHAFEFFDTYIDCACQPLLAHYKYLERDTMMPQAAYWAVYSGYKLQDAQATLKYKELALSDTTRQAYLLQYLGETYKLQGDTANYLQILRQGIANHPSFPYFFPRLIDHYASQGEPQTALDVCNQALLTDPRNPYYRLAKSTLLLSLRRYDECIAICDELIAAADTLADAYYNAGAAYFNQTIDLQRGQETRQQRARRQALYKQALPYLQRYRILAPHAQERWAMPLYTIYLNLNMGKEFDEIDALLRNKKKE